MSFSLLKKICSLSPMTEISIHAICAADDRTGSRSMRLLRILAVMTLFFNKSIYATHPVNEMKDAQALSFEASSCAPEILRAIYSALNEEDKEKSIIINLENDVPITECAKIHGHLLNKDKYQKVRSLDLSNLGIGDLPAFIFKHMMNLESLNLSGNANINLNSEAFESLCQKLVVLDVSCCNIDENTFSIICKRCSNLKILKASSNPRIKFPEQDLIEFKDTLEELKIDDCILDADDMKQITEFKSLERLDISNNRLEEFFEKFDLDNLKDTLTELRVSKVGITLRNLCKITECSKITVLDISDNNLKKEDACSTYTDIFWNIILYFLGFFFRTDVFLENLADRLTSLNVSGAHLSINQLKKILDSPSIETLDCSCNDFSGLDDTFEIGRAKSALRDAKFSNCYIQSPKFLSEILDCPCLTKLDISKNKFNMLYKFTFGSSVNSLKWLDISESEINVRPFIEILGKSELIKYLDISGGDLIDLLQDPGHTPIEFDPSKVVSTIGGLKKSLKILKTSNCKLEDDYPLLYSLTDCENLEHLDISGNDFSRFPAGFQFGSSRETLKYLNMRCCGIISMSTLRAVTDLKVLEILNMNDNRYETTQEHFKLGASKNSLKTVSMSGSRGSFNPSILQAISECNTLETLDLSGSYMGNFELENFGAARSSLRKINMEHCRINSKVLLAVLDCKNLQELDLSNNDLSYLSGDFRLGDSKDSLKVLKMNVCRLRSHILSEITDCSSLKELDLSKNNFSGVSDDFKLGKSKDMLEIIDMSSCGICSEKMLIEITGCSNLKKLNLSFNSFSEIFADFSFGNSRCSLKVLKMDRCGMTNLFTAITSCEVLETLSVRGNSLSSYDFGVSKKTWIFLGILFQGLKTLTRSLNVKG